MNEEAASPAPAAVVDVTGSRIVAALIDIVLLAIVFVIMALLFGDTDSGSDGEEGGFYVSLSGAPFIVYLLIVAGYYFVLEMQNGQTVGKRIMHLRVVAVDGVLTPQKVLIRTLLRIVDGLPAFYLVGLLVSIMSSRKQRVGDMAAGTLVVKA